jgi:copper resistance protein B
MSPMALAAQTAPMQGMDMDHGAMHQDATDQAHSQSAQTHRGMTMGSMQGGAAPADARSPDYSDGQTYGDMAGMDMQDHATQSMLLVDQLESFHARDANGLTWEAEAWYGTDDEKLWLRTEGERSTGHVRDADVEALWSHTLATYWNTQLGIRQDAGGGPPRSWAAFGIEGLAPYWFDVQATAYVGQAGRIAARLRTEYDLRFTQRLILQPELEANLYSKSDRQRRIGDGVSDVQLGLRLRYEISRRFAPYFGVVWVRRFGPTAGFARQDREPVFDQQIVVGLHLWF